jgi:hypothetical protein
MQVTNWAEVARWGKVQAWWLRHPDIDADHLSALAALATYADEARYCEPSQATLARWLKRSRPWVNRVIAELVGVRLLEKTTRSRPNGGTTSCRYRLLSQAGVIGANPPGNMCDPPSPYESACKRDSRMTCCPFLRIGPAAYHATSPGSSQAISASCRDTTFSTTPLTRRVRGNAVSARHLDLHIARSVGRVVRGM